MTQIACQTGLSREQLYRSFSADGNPTLRKTLAVMKALGIELAYRRTGAAARLPDMNARVDHLLDEALGLPTEERSALVVALLDSLEGADDAAVSDAWRAEVTRRRAELRAGVTHALPWAEAKARLSAA